MTARAKMEFDAEDMKVLDRLLEREFVRLENDGRDMKTDPDVIRVGTWWRFVQEWLLDQGEM